MILAGDVGGTKTDLARRRRGERPCHPGGGARAREEEQRGEGAEASDYFTSPA